MPEYCYTINGQCRNIVAIFLDIAGILLHISGQCWTLQEFVLNIYGQCRNIVTIIMENSQILLQYFWTFQVCWWNISGQCKDIDGKFLDCARILLQYFRTWQEYCYNILNIHIYNMTNAGILLQYFWTIHIDGILYISGVKSHSG